MKCENCIHENICDALDGKMIFCSFGDKECEHFTDMGKMIELPCKAGDVVYEVILGNIESRTVRWICQGRATQFIFTVLQRNGKEYSKSINIKDIGKTVFLTKEAAQAELDRLEGKE